MQTLRSPRASALGAVLVLLSVVSAHAQEAGDRAAGAEVFKKCVACHRVGPGAKNGVGPALNGIVGRAAGTYAGYNYSAANRNSNLTWDVATLTQYLKAPRAMVPGTKMTFAGLPQPKEIADVIAYLAGFDGAGNPVPAK